ncbi:hypothetical protein [Streptomyces sp. DH8]|uniref:hypothetical protein n=1 Tax=Streptomyces sp. DH8 TaxID=2857008 RepID=UPI001E4EE4BF|nr:hypothetical protein [Streptomyces sp. DH8]
MRIRRSRLTRDFLQVPNATVRDSRLSHMARGILVDLLSRPDGWETTADDMWRESLRQHGDKSPGRRAFRAAFAELKALGYLTSERAALEEGKHGTVLTVRDIPAGHADVPHGGTSGSPAKTGISAGHADVPHGGTSGSPAEMGESAGHADVPHAGTSYRKRSVKKTGEEKKTCGPDAVGQSAGGFARADAEDGAAAESDQVDGGSAASGPNSLPTQRKRSPRPATTKTRPRKQSPGFDLVRAAIPPEVARPGTKLFPGLHRAIEDLLTGSQGIPARTPEQVVARINRRWYGEKADERSAADYRGCARCTASGCQAPRHSTDTPDGCDRIKNPNSWLAAAILAQDCPDAGCEDGWIIGGDRCQVCERRAAERRRAAKAAAEAAARWEAEIEERETVTAEQAAVAAWTSAEAAEERRVRQILAETGMYGVLLDHRVHQHMTGWRNKHPRPSPQQPPVGPQRPIQGAFLIPMPGGPPDAPQRPQNDSQRRTPVQTQRKAVNSA